jgi:hypothetical protein
VRPGRARLDVGDCDRAPGLLGGRFRASTITYCVGTGRTERPPRPRSPGCRLAGVAVISSLPAHTLLPIVRSGYADVGIIALIPSGGLCRVGNRLETFSLLSAISRGELLGIIGRGWRGVPWLRHRRSDGRRSSRNSQRRAGSGPLSPHGAGVCRPGCPVACSIPSPPGGPLLASSPAAPGRRTPSVMPSDRETRNRFTDFLLCRRNVVYKCRCSA